MSVPFSIALHKCYRAQSNVLRPLIAEIGLSPGQPKILDFLLRHEGCMQKDLAALCDIEPATVSRLLDKLEHDGLIRRASAAGDKRAAIVSLTDAGRSRQVRLQTLRSQAEAQSLAGFSGPEREQFYAYLERFYYNLTHSDLCKREEAR